MNWDTVKNFKESEFADNTGKCWIDEKLVYKIDQARDMVDFPFIITSACRNQSQNTNAGGKPNSSHLSGHAVDIYCDKSWYRYEIFKALMDVGINRIGISSNFMHADIDPTKPKNVIWTY